MTTPRLPIPAALLDPAFLACVANAARQPELVKEFDRLRGSDLSLAMPPICRLIDEATGKQDGDLGEFVRFVHDCVYCRLDDSVIDDLRAQAALVA